MWYDPTAAPGWHDWLGLVLTVIGFWVAIVQLRKTRSASVEAARELSRAREKLNADQLSANVAQLQLVGTDLDFAIWNNDAEVAHRSLVRFNYLANEVVALLDNHPGDNAELAERLKQAASDAREAKAEIVSTKRPDVVRVAKAVGRAVTELTGDIAGIVATDRYQLGGASDVR